MFIKHQCKIKVDFFVSANHYTFRISNFNCLKFMVTFLSTIKDAYPDNPKEINMVNMPPFMERVCQTMMSFGNKKVKERTKLYPKGADCKKLHDVLGKDVLPAEYGGNAGPIQLQIGKFQIGSKSYCLTWL